jgi:anti-sigma factor RsiW
MNCDDPRVLMHGHLDGELDLADDLEVQRHIEECPSPFQQHRREA